MAASAAVCFVVDAAAHSAVAAEAACSVVDVAVAAAHSVVDVAVAARSDGAVVVGVDFSVETVRVAVVGAFVVAAPYLVSVAEAQCLVYVVVEARHFYFGGPVVVELVAGVPVLAFRSFGVGGVADF